jgi:hypothetical protein
MNIMNKIVELLQKALGEAERVEVLGVCDRAHLNKATNYIEEALKEIDAQEGDSDQDKEALEELERQGGFDAQDREAV